MGRATEKLVSFGEYFRRFDIRFGRRVSYLEIAVLLTVISLAFAIRILPSRWGLLLSEFDPWWHFKIANFIIERGWSGFLEFVNWVDTKSWYPTGIAVGKVFFPGVAFTMAFIYLFLASLGIEVSPLELAAILPVLYGMLTIVVVYLLARRLLGSHTGLAAAMLMAVSNAHISRTHLGWFDDESLSIPLMLGGYLAYLVAIDERRSIKGAILYGLLAGLLLGYMAASWGAHKFPLALMPLFTAVLVFLGRYRRTILAAYVPMLLTYTFIAVSVPKLGLRYLSEVTIAVGFITLGYLLLAEFFYRYLERNRATVLLRGTALIALLGLLVMLAFQAIGLPHLKFFSVLAPWLRGELPIVISVAENQVSTWVTIFQDFGPPLLLVPYGIYLLVKRGKDTDVFLLLYSVFALYFAASMVRLVLLTSAAVAIVGGHTLATMLTRAGEAFATHKMQRRGIKAPKALFVVPLVFAVLLVAYYQPVGLGGGLGVSPIDAGYLPSTLASSSIPVRQPIYDWIRALAWMRDNLPATAVVASWWDYGDWITIVGNKTSLIDNTTIDSKRIAKVAYAFMSPEDVSYRVFKEMGATHVLIFVTHGQLQVGTQPVLLGFGDESKWIWMVRIANQEAEALGIERIDEASLVGPDGDPTNPTDKFWNSTTLGLLIPFKPQEVNGQRAYLYQEPNLTHYRLVYSSSPPYQSFAYVFIYEIVD